MSEFWNRCLEELRQRYAQEVFQNWFADLQADETGLESGSLTLIADSGAKARTLQTSYGAQIQTVINQTAGREIDITWEVSESEVKPAAAPFAAESAPAAVQTALQDTGLLPNLTFENIVEGKLAVEREFRRNGIRLDEAQREAFVLQTAQKQRVNTTDDFYAAIGYGGISLTKMMPHIKEDYNKLIKAQQQNGEEPIIKTVPIKPKKTRSDGVVIEGIENCLVKFSKCCNPLPGDDIIGFITRGHGVSIHKRDCTNVPKRIELSQEPERWIKAYWDSDVKEDFKANIAVTGMDRTGLLMDITAQFAAMHVDIHSVNTKTKKDGRAVMNFVITVNGTEHLKNVMAKLSKVNGVLDVERSNV